MGTITGIEWTATYHPDGSITKGKTWNPWQGCNKVSPGCAHCYMYTEKLRYGQEPATVIRSQPATFYAPLKWREPAKVFTCSWSDWFHEVADPWRDEAWGIVRRTDWLLYLILTKRIERALDHLPADWGPAGYPNVQLMTSVENQHWADLRIPQLLHVPARLHGLSCEPLLGPVDLQLEGRNYGIDHAGWSERVSWVIIGGESGPKARRMDPAWLESLIAQCQAAGVPVFVKQLGERLARELGCRDRKGGDMTEWPAAWQVRQFPSVPPAGPLDGAALRS